MEIKRVNSAEIILTMPCDTVSNVSWKELEEAFAINDLNNKMHILVRE